jgi:2-oxo-4-hydroxy-4-carboxy--5-ureidoimidazoline (OHCU) decarboxylase
MKQKPTTAKRLDGKKKLLSLTARMEADLRLYCRERNIENESELIRQAVVKYLDADYDDNTLKLSGLKDLRESVERIRDMMTVVFKYLRLMHVNLLAYHPEIAAEYKDAAFKSASSRHDKFFAGFQERLREDPSFFERLLHTYVTGELDGTP